MYLFIGVYFSNNIMFSAYLYVPKCTSKFSEIINTSPVTHLRNQSSPLLLSVYTVNKPLREPEITWKWTLRSGDKGWNIAPLWRYSQFNLYPGDLSSKDNNINNHDNWIAATTSEHCLSEVLCWPLTCINSQHPQGRVTIYISFHGKRGTASCL